ncbi:PAS domain S-box protein [Pacificoceanicola onchidii]|uniref:PAS domain S-box protein n=1 Tax=Pacificoceanicola onchidii TaxID=2562685 RepID=UPI0010A3F0F6|nr:PAS domain S-box protein [Pacificoceanicola onchidii]
MTTRPDMSLERLVPAGVFLIVIVVTAVFQTAYRGIQEERRSAEVRVAAESFAARLETHVTARLNAGQLLGRRFVEKEDATAETFRAETALLHELFRDFQALNWVDSSGIIRIVTPEEGNGAALGLNLRLLPVPAQALASAAQTGTLQVTPPLTLAQGGTGFVAYVPVSNAEASVGFINIVFRAEPLIRNAVGPDMARAFAVRVLDGEAPLFTSGRAMFRPGSYALRTIPVAGRAWQLQVARNPAAAAPAGSYVDEAILLGGALLAVLLGMLSHMLIARQSALHDSRSRFRDFSSVSSDWYWETDVQGRVTWVSKGIEAFYGKSRHALIGKTRADVREAGHDEEAWAAHQADLRAHRAFRDYIYATRVRGEQRWVRVSGVPVFDRSGTFQGYRGAGSDTTDLVRSRGAAETANARLAMAVEGLNEVFSLWDEDDRLVFGNRIFRELNSTIPEVTVPGTRFEDYLRAGVQAGHMPDLEGCEEEFIRDSLARRHAPDSGPFEVERTDGTVLLLNEQRLPEGGIITTGQDITQQKRNEAALRASEERLAMASQQLSIWDWDVDEDILYMSPGFAERLGYSAEEFAAIKADSVSTIIHPDDVESYCEKLEHHLVNPASTFVNEHRFRTRDGDYRWFLAIGQTERDADGKSVRSTGVLTDIHERVELQNALRQAQKMEAIGNLTGGVAHDFNNLLTIILGNLELIRECYDAPEARELVEAGITATQRGADLVRNMLGFARKSRLQPAEVNLNDLLDNTASWVTRTLPETITLDTRQEPALWEVSVDPTLTQNVILNLILNARDAMPEGGRLFVETCNVHLKTAEKDADGDDIAPGRYVRLTVRDTGSGISRADLGKVFEPFFTTKPPGAGSGLGLSLAHGFMKQSGGAVRAYSPKGKGAVFELLFPATGAEPRVDRAPKPETPPHRAASGRIFLVEDEAEVLNVLTRMLSRAGYTVTTATSGDEALAQWEQIKTVDLVITDIVMPGKLQGTDLAAELHRRRPDLPIIFLSGYAAHAQGDGPAVPPGSLRLMKPVAKTALLDAVEQALRLVAA